MDTKIDEGLDEYSCHFLKNLNRIWKVSLVISPSATKLYSHASAQYFRTGLVHLYLHPLQVKLQRTHLYHSKQPGILTYQVIAGKLLQRNNHNPYNISMQYWGKK